MHPAIIIPAYSRDDSLKRLLGSINDAVYPANTDIELIISIDGGASKSVMETAESFTFKHGNVTISKKEENIGLSNHLLWCGGQSHKYGSIIILEDDLFVDKYFYLYTVAALNFYKNVPKIAGIALYSPQYNQMAKLGFEAMNNGFTSYFIQKVCTWGEAFTSEQWTRFQNWYEKAEDEMVENNLEIPHTVKTWNAWDKFFSAYMVEEDTYFVFPYSTFSTNFADPGGVHMKSGTDLFQVPLGAVGRPPEEFSFCTPDESTVVYDAFMEPGAPEIFEAIGISPDNLEIDFFGIKPISILKNKKYVLTSKKCRPVIKTFRMGARPIEKTILNPVPNRSTPKFGFSNHIYLSESKNIISPKRPFYEQINYYSYYQIENKYFFRRYMLHLAANMLKLNK